MRLLRIMRGKPIRRIRMPIILVSIVWSSAAGAATPPAIATSSSSSSSDRQAQGRRKALSLLEFSRVPA